MTSGTNDQCFTPEGDHFNDPWRGCFATLVTAFEIFELVNVMDIDLLVSAAQFAPVGEQSGHQFVAGRNDGWFLIVDGGLWVEANGFSPKFGNQGWLTFSGYLDD